MKTVRKLSAVVVSALVVIFAGVSFPGCDMGTYSSRYSERAGELQRRADLTKSLHLGANAITTPDGRATGMEIRLPSCFDENSTYYGAKKAASSPGKAQPPGIDLPGFSFSLERYVATASGKEAPVYVYIADIPKADKEEEELLDEILAEVNKNFERLKLRWEPVSITELGGETVTWSRINTLVAQPFFVKTGTGKKAKENLETMEGHLEIYFRSTPQYYLIVCCRVPAEIEADLKLREAIEGSLGTVKTG